MGVGIINNSSLWLCHLTLGILRFRGFFLCEAYMLKERIETLANQKIVEFAQAIEKDVREECARVIDSMNEKNAPDSKEFYSLGLVAATLRRMQ